LDEGALFLRPMRLHQCEIIVHPTQARFKYFAKLLFIFAALPNNDYDPNYQKHRTDAKHGPFGEGEYRREHINDRSVRWITQHDQ
jgi:hypothetical protein